MNGNTPGNAETNPFGDGSGGADKMAGTGNNFLTNPAGSKPDLGGGTDFVKNPAGSKPGGSQAKGNDFVTNPAGQLRGTGGTSAMASPAFKDGSRPTTSGSDPVNQQDKAQGEPTAAQVATPKGDVIAKRDIGTVAGQAVHKPFKLSGG